jgi:trafficking protein particle complex subunit 11
VRYRPHRVRVSLIHQSPAYLDEEYPIVIGITNEDDRPLDVVLDILLQPTEIDEAGTSRLRFMST